jgi:aspartyl protease family protein
MATGFMRHFISLCLLLACAVFEATAADVALIGVIGNKAAVLAIDGGNPKTVKVGQKWSGITVLTVERERAMVEIDGKRRTLTRGMHYRSAAAGPPDRQAVTLAADPAGHFFAEGAINGIPVRFVVDTGATFIALPGAQATRLGIDYKKGARGAVQTANGPATAYQIKLDTVKLGGIELTLIDGVVIEEGLSVALLGMSFLNRVEMKRDGDTMTLTRRF